METAQAVPVAVEAARQATLEATVAATGTIVPAPGGDWTISAPEPARIAELPKSEGQTVEPGDVLVRFDIPTLPADLAAKRAAVEQAKVSVDTAKANVTRETTLLDRGVAAARDVEQARQQQADAESALAQATSAVTAAVALDARAVVQATFPGVVAKRWHNPGDLVDATASDPILRIINPRALQVVASVPIGELPRVALGHEARIVGPGGGDGERAKVDEQTWAGGTGQRDGRRAPGVCLADDSRGRHDGERLRSTPKPARTSSSSPTPPSCMRTRTTYVMVAGSDGKAHKHDVHVGLASGELVEITSGLAAGDQAIVRGQDGLPDGAAITVTK